jgi:type II secretory pathway component GspD/PulD (secretin)
MRRIPACWRTLLVGAVVALAPVSARAAPAAPEKAVAVNPVEKLRKDLDKPITLKIEKQPLSTAVEMLHKQTGITFLLDSPTIQQMGFTPEQPPTPVEVDLKDVKVRAALRTILSPYGLSFAPIGDTVVITTEDAAMYRQMRQRVSVDMEKVDFAAALKQIGRETAVNLIVDTRVEKEAGAKVSLKMEDVPLETVVRLLAEMASLKPVRVGNVLFVTNKANANEMRADPDLAQPNVNQQAQQQFLIQQQLQGGQFIGGLGQIGGNAVAIPGIVAPPGVAPVVPPVAAPNEKDEKDKPAADPKSSDDKPAAGDKKDPPPLEAKPLAK